MTDYDFTESPRMKAECKREREQFEADSEAVQSEITRDCKTLTKPQRVCVKAQFLRCIGYDNLREFEADNDNARLTRRGRVFIKEKSGKTKPYCYNASRFANPFGLADHTRKESLEKYAAHLDRMLATSDDARREFEQLRSKKRLGCYCEPFDSCHVNVVIDRLARGEAQSDAQSEEKKRKLK